MFYYGAADWIRVVTYSFSILVIVRIFLSYFAPKALRGGEFVRFVNFYTEPLLKPFRFTLPVPIDISPMFALILLIEFERLAIHLLSLF